MLCVKENKEDIKTIINDKNVKLLWVQILGPKLTKEFKKIDLKTNFTLRRNLRDLIDM